MRNYLLEIAYDGSAFSGWQRQAGFDTVQERLEDALAILARGPVTVHGSGRTDAGVHALRQAAHVRLEKHWEPHQLLRAINGHMPDQIRVRTAREVPAQFHARFSAVGKRYVYRTIVDSILPVFGRGRYHWVRRPVDLNRMRTAAELLRGTHDFVSFSSNPGYERKRGTVRTLSQLRVVRRPHGFDVFAQANGFLYNMVRTLAGTLIDIGLGKHEPEWVTEILASQDRRLAGLNAPAEGLYQLRALYPREALGSDGRTQRSAQLTNSGAHETGTTVVDGRAPIIPTGRSAT